MERPSSYILRARFLPLTYLEDAFSLFENDVVKEVWINGGGKAGTERFDILTEFGRLVSVALQNGTPLEELKSCATFHTDGRPSTIVGEVFNQLEKLS